MHLQLFRAFLLLRFFALNVKTVVVDLTRTWYKRLFGQQHYVLYR